MPPKDGIILDVVDGSDRVIGQATRKEIHEKGLLHREIHVWFVTPAGEIVFQHRAKDKDTFPDLLDATVGGHVERGDSYEETALKEMAEETGVVTAPEDLHMIAILHKRSDDVLTGTINNTVRAEYAYIYRGDVGDLKIEEGKAMGFEAHLIDSLLRPTEEDKKRFIPNVFDADILDIFKHIKKLVN